MTTTAQHSVYTIDADCRVALRRCKNPVSRDNIGSSVFDNNIVRVDQPCTRLTSSSRNDRRLKNLKTFQSRSFNKTAISAQCTTTSTQLTINTRGIARKSN